MKFRCERDVLVEALASASRATSGRERLPVLAGARLAINGDELRIIATDLDLTIEVVATVAGIADGVSVIPAKLAADIVRSLEPGAVTIEADEEQAKIASGRSQFAVRVLPAEEFPMSQGEVGSDAVTVASGELADALRQVVRAASGDEARPILTGVLFMATADGMQLLATDSYRLAVRQLPGVNMVKGEQKVLIPSRALAELQRLLNGAPECAVRLGTTEASFEVGHVRLTTRLIEGEFPNVLNLIPASFPNELTVNRDALLDAVKRVKLMVRDQTTPVRLALRSDGVELMVSNPAEGTATEDVEAKFLGADMTVAFNPQYLTDGIEAITGDELTLETQDTLKPCVLRGVGAEEYLYLLMPVRVP
ncbi:MAG TPA: DNA polymerase III subunit beta [Acidimicrobiales bacterium]|nr:DNA polymerase III subunit beta [Acidimicrobiales bacterium]